MALIDKIGDRDGWRCHYCGKDLSWVLLRPEGRGMPKGVTADHVIPCKLEGPDGAWNLVLSCTPCNSAKGHLTYEEFTGKDELPEQCHSRAHTTAQWIAEAPLRHAAQRSARRAADRAEARREEQARMTMLGSDRWGGVWRGL